MVVESPEDGPLAGAESRSRKWRGKLFSKDKTPKVSLDAQVDDFLGSHRPALPPRSSASPIPPPPHPAQQQQQQPYDQQFQHQFQQSRAGVTAAPRLNVALSQRWPDSHDLSTRSPPRSSLDTYDNPLTKQISPQKKKGRKGLRVAFSSNDPEVIGEGGDECELPTKDVLLYRSRSYSSASVGTDRTYSQSENAHPYGSPAESQASSNWDGGHNQGSTEDSFEKPPLMKNAHEVDFLLSLGGQGPGSRLSMRESGDPNSFTRRVQARMRAEEGLALQKRRSESLTGADEPDFQRPSQETTSLPHRPSITSNHSPDGPREQTSPVKNGFWGGVMSSLPGETRSSRQNSQSSQHPTTNVSRPGTHSSTPPPPYIGSPTLTSEPETIHELDPEPVQRRVESPPNNDVQGAKEPAPLKMTLRAAANVVSNDALSDFAARATQYSAIFSDAAENVKPSMETSLSEWIRASVWWFLKGRSQLEASIRPPTSDGGRNSPPTAEQTQQGVLDLAKAWWINQHVVPQHPELSRFGNMSTETMIAVATTAGDQKLGNLMGLHQAIISHLRALTMSMKRNGIIDTALDRMDLSRGLDTSIWVRYPFFTADISAVLSGQVTRSMLVDTTPKTTEIADVMPLGDTNRYFSYGRMFIEAYLSSSEDDSQQFAIPCVLSIVRDRTDWNVLASITSQNELVNIMIQGDKKQGPTWADVDWGVRTCSMRIRLPRGFELDIQFNQPDFRMLWKIVEYTHKTEESLQAEPGETLLFEDVLKVFQYMDSSPNKAFPPEPSPRCRIRLFERTVTITEGTGTRKAHRGFRFIAVTSPKVKTLSSVSHELGNGTPIVFGYLRGEDGAPALLLKVQEGGATRSLLLTFHEQEERSKMHSLLLGITPLHGEVKTPDIPMRSFSIEQPADYNSTTQPITHLQFSSPSAAVINNTAVYSQHGYSSTVLSEHLRVFVTSNWGSATDRINIGPGELKIALDVNMPTAMSILRPPQQDLGISVAENLVPKETAGNMTQLLRAAQTTPVIRRYIFSALQDLHRFEQAITNFRVLFDGARVQVVEQEKIIQLVAFFHEFNHGQCMNFVLKSTDVFEIFNHRSGKYGIKIVDAKFALPKPDDDDSAGFVCLDMPEYPGEHDDITIAFDSETERTDFQAVLPGSIKEPSRMGSLRK
ncbi:hypothetical protein AJ79_05018 [Helicocarpus griseus UAMH5409]|uniref:Uncharacterized protein n=1 Tax=Helicocarpus griseus UAMH5409 TaxID=1447875 RepID=A0A2B7XPU8_9EURO|nr:hypothetical protein AJ79_05018 [Helicocarpus griseus UAMH5409]